MEEFTNGTSLTSNAVWKHDSDGEFSAEAYCPYCGWVYDQPDTVIPDHAACGHLVATAQWTLGLHQLSIGAVAAVDGSWSFWQPLGSATCRDAVEHALRGVSVKVESATAATEIDARGNRFACRYYFSRRPSAAAGELAVSLPSEARPAFRPSGDTCCRTRSMCLAG